MTIEAAITKLQTHALALTGMKDAPDQPPETINVFPFSIAYERTAETLQRGYGFADDIVTLWVEFHVARQLLQGGVQTAMALRDPFLKKLIGDPTLGGSVSTITAIRRTFGWLKWGGTDTIGYRFEIDVKIDITN